jgi:SatD family (SatD)
MTKNVTYVAVLADVVGSRTLPPKARARLQTDIQARLADLNKRWRSGIAAGFAIARGDEIEGLLHDADLVWDVSHWLRSALDEVDWTIACARGPISTGLAKTALEVDGPCFHDARTALDEAKERRRVFAFRGFAPAVDALSAYYSALYWSWTPRQRRQASQLRFYGPGLDKLKERLNVYTTAVSHMKRRMAWPLVAEGDRMLRAAIATMEGR